MDWRAIVLTAAGSLGSIALNVAGVGLSDDPLDYVVAAVPPVAALLAFGVLMRQVHEFLSARQSFLTAPPVPSGASVTPPVEREEPEVLEEPQEAMQAPADEPVMTPDEESVSEPEEPGEPLTQRDQMDLIVWGLYDSLGQQRPGTRHMRQALADAGLPPSNGPRQAPEATVVLRLPAPGLTTPEPPERPAGGRASDVASTTRRAKRHTVPMAYDLSKGAPAPQPEAQVFKGYVATVTLYVDQAQIKRKLMGKVTGAKDCVIPLGDVIKVQSKEPTRLVNGYVQLATEEDWGQLRIATAEAQKAIANNSRTVLFTWNQRETYAAYLAAATVGVQAQGGNPFG
ncbi:hypothetical protein ACK03K_33385 [[Kitasatospora] papulosa]|uniref:hypothetical protein n=1 Tax=[Kitasatospora] papulosa TaxID=1464011 RepID=UPI003907F7C7